MCLHDHLKPVGLAPCQRKEKGEGFQKASTTATGGRMPPRLTQCNIEKGDRGTDWWIAKPMAFWTQAIFLSPRADSAISRPDVPKGIWPMQRSGISVGSDQRPSRWVSAGEQICHIGSNGLFHPLPCGNPVRQAADDQLFFFFFFHMDICDIPVAKCFFIDVARGHAEPSLPSHSVPIQVWICHGG